MDTDILVMKNGEKNRSVVYIPSGELMLRCESSDDICLCRDISDDFDACVDVNGVIDVFAVNTKGNLCHIRYSGGRIIQNTVMESREAGNRICSVRVIKINNKMHLFYCLSCSERLLVHHIVDFNDYKMEPEVIDRIGKKYVYDVVADEMSNIHIIYSSNNGKILKRTYIYKNKSHTPPEFVADYEARSMGLVCIEDEQYAVFTALKKGHNTVFVCNVLKRDIAVAGVHVHMRTQTSIFPDGEEIIIEWIENAMCFSVRCSKELNLGRVSARGRSDGMIKVRLCEPSILINHMAKNTSGIPFTNPRSFALKEKTTNEFLPKGYEVDMMSKKYLEVLSGKNEFASDFKEDLMMIEASLERLVLLVERALERSVNNEKVEYNEEEISKEDL